MKKTRQHALIFPPAWNWRTTQMHNIPWQPPNGPVRCCCTLFAVRAYYTDRQTDHATPSVAIGRTYIVLQCGLIIQRRKN